MCQRKVKKKNLKNVLNKAKIENFPLYRLMTFMLATPYPSIIMIAVKKSIKKSQFCSLPFFSLSATVPLKERAIEGWLPIGYRQSSLLRKSGPTLVSFFSICQQQIFFTQNIFTKAAVSETFFSKKICRFYFCITVKATKLCGLLLISSNVVNKKNEECQGREYPVDVKKPREI